MREKTPTDYADFPITKLPPGTAYGAGDLTKWSSRRRVGRAGTGPSETVAISLECKKCDQNSDVFGPSNVKKGKVRICPRCNRRAAIVRRVRVLKEGQGK